MHEIRVLFTPEMASQPQLQNTTCVVVDILRATSCWVTAMANGAKSIRPVTKLKECQQLGHKGYLTAAERGGKKVEGFDLGNSPLEYTEKNVSGKKIAVTTTNGTRAVQKALLAKEVYIGAFLNIIAIAGVLKDKERVSILCAGWESNPGMEDVLFAGELVSLLSNTHMITDDGPLMAFELYKKSKNNLMFFLSQATHFKRLIKLGLKKDIEYCTQKNIFDITPMLQKDEIMV